MELPSTNAASRWTAAGAGRRVPGKQSMPRPTQLMARRMAAPQIPRVSPHGSGRSPGFRIVPSSASPTHRRGMCWTVPGYSGGSAPGLHRFPFSTASPQANSSARVWRGRTRMQPCRLLAVSPVCPCSLARERAPQRRAPEARARPIAAGSLRASRVPHSQAPFPRMAAPTTTRLILQADDFGMTHEVNLGILRAYTHGLVTQASIMVPCPWFEEGAALAKLHRIPVGIHLTATCEFEFYRWRPLTCGKSLGRSADGTCHQTVAAARAACDKGELEREFIAQVERALAAGLTPALPGCAHGRGRTRRWSTAVCARHRLPGGAPRREMTDGCPHNPVFATDPGDPACTLPYVSPCQLADARRARWVVLHFEGPDAPHPLHRQPSRRGRRGVPRHVPSRAPRLPVGAQHPRHRLPGADRSRHRRPRRPPGHRGADHPPTPRPDSVRRRASGCGARSLSSQMIAGQHGIAALVADQQSLDDRCRCQVVVDERARRRWSARSRWCRR